MAESRRMGKTELFTHFAERFGIRPAAARDFLDELQQLSGRELLRCGEFVLPGIAKLVVQKRERRTGRNPATGADGWADVGKRHRFAWEHKGKHADPDVAVDRTRQ